MCRNMNVVVNRRCCYLLSEKLILNISKKSQLLINSVINQIAENSKK